MTLESEMAKDIGYRFDCKKDAFKQNQDGTVKVTLSVHPDDIPWELMKDCMGQRYVAVMVPVGDDEKPRLPPGAPDDYKKTRGILKPFLEDKPKSYAQQAKMLAKNDSYWIQKHDIDTQDIAEDFIREFCSVDSCSKIIEGTEAGVFFKKLQGDYMEWKNDPPLHEI